MLQSNMNFLQKEFPEIHELLLNDTKSQAYELFNTKANEPNVTIQFEDKVVPIHSNYNAMNEARKWVHTVKEEIEKNKNILLIGLGLGYFLEALLEIPNDKYIYLYEPDLRVFRSMVHNREIQGFLNDRRIQSLAVGDHQLVQLQLAQVISERISDSFVCLVPPVYQKLFDHIITGFGEQLKRMMYTNLGDLHTFSLYHQEWMKNSLFNLPHVINNPSIRDLRGIFKDIPAVIIGSGPSLQHDIQYLDELKEHCLIIAAGSSLQALQEQGKDPHLVVSMDGGEPNYQAFRNLNTRNVPLLFVPSIKWKILDGYQGKMMHVGFNSDTITDYLVDYSEHNPIFSTSTTVTGTAIQAACFYGCPEIILMGQDLSFPNDKMYTIGVNHLSEQTVNNYTANASEWVENVKGGRNRTSLKLLNVLKDLELLIQAKTIEGFAFYNSSKEGAVIKETRWIDIGDYVKELKSKPQTDYKISEILADHLTNQGETGFSKTRVLSKLNQINRETIQITKDLKGLSKLLESLQNAVDNHNTKQVLVNLERINSLWDKIVHLKVYKHFYTYLLKHHISIFMRYIPDIAKEQNAILKAKLILKHLSKLVFQISEFTPSLLETLDAAISRITSTTSETR